MSEIYYRVPKESLEEIYLFHYNYTADKRTKYIWDWEYGDINPNNSLLLAVKYDDKVIATQGMMSVKIAFGRDVFITGKNESLLIDKEHRGKGLSTRLYNYAIREYEKEGISILWGFSRKAIIPLKKADFRIFEGVMKRMVLTTDYKHTQNLLPKSGLNGFKIALFKLALFTATRYSALMLNFRCLFTNTGSKNVERCFKLKNTNDIVHLYNQIISLYPDLIYIYQDKEYYNWRVEKSPSPITTLFLYEKDVLKGYLYLKCEERFCELTDITFIHEKYGMLLIKELLKFRKQNDFKFIYYTGNIKNKLNRSVFTLLGRYGFLKIKGPNHFVLRNFNFKDEGVLNKIENWYINDLWSEGI